MALHFVHRGAVANHGTEKVSDERSRSLDLIKIRSK